MIKLLMSAAVAAMVLSVGAADAKTHHSMAKTSHAKMVSTKKMAPMKGTTGSATKGTTGSATSSKSEYDASPTNGTNTFQAPPEGQGGVKPGTGANPPRQPAN